MKNSVESGTVQSRSGITLIVAGFLVAGIFGYLDAREIDMPLATRFISMVMIVEGRFYVGEAASIGHRRLPRVLSGMVNRMSFI
jgi:hypothetical protein